VYVNSKKDTRASEDVLRTHDNVRFDCIKTNSLEEVDFSDVDVIAIDEAQFFTGLKTFRRVIMGSNISISPGTPRLVQPLHFGPKKFFTQMTLVSFLDQNIGESSQLS